MKKSFNVDICGVSYRIDEDAMQLLEQCMKSAADRAVDGGKETVAADFERRVGDALCSRVGAGGVVTLDIVKEVLAAVGVSVQPDDATSAKTASSEAAGGTQDDEPWRVAMLLGNKLYRDPCDKLLGGVLSGVAHYTGVSCIALRLMVLIAALPFFWAVLIAYLVLWMVLPVPTDVICMTRMHRVSSNNGNVEEQWRANYERCVHEMTYHRCDSGGCSTAVRGLLLLLLAVVAFPFVIAAVALVFAFFVTIAALLSVFGAGIFSTSYITLLLLLPIFALGHWILKKCGVCRPLGRGVKAVIIIGWLALFAFTAVKMNERVEERGGWAQVERELDIDSDRFYNRLMRKIDGLVSHCSSELSQYVVWRVDNRGLPFHVVYKRGFDGGGKEFLFYDRNADVDDEPMARIELDAPDTQGIAIYCLWDSAANEMLVDGSAYARRGQSSELRVEATDISIRFAHDSLAVRGDSVPPGVVPIALRCKGVGFWNLNLFGDELHEGVYVEPSIKHVGHRMVLY